jgi:hypothetical protein
MHIKTWHVELFIYEEDDATTARAVLHTEAPTHLEGHGAARRKPGDPAVDEIGDEVAAARALHELATTLLSTAAADIADVSDIAVHLPHPRPDVPVR